MIIHYEDFMKRLEKKIRLSHDLGKAVGEKKMKELCLLEEWRYVHLSKMQVTMF